MHHTERIIEDMVRATCKGKSDMRARHLMRESLRSLVRMAKTEKLLEIRNSSLKLACSSGKLASSTFHTAP